MKNVIRLDNMGNTFSLFNTKDEGVMFLTHYDFFNSNYEEEILNTAINNYMNEYNNKMPAKIVIVDSIPLNMHIEEFNCEPLVEYALNRFNQNDCIILNVSEKQ